MLKWFPSLHMGNWSMGEQVCVACRCLCRFSTKIAKKWVCDACNWTRIVYSNFVGKHSTLVLQTHLAYSHSFSSVPPHHPALLALNESIFNEMVTIPHLQLASINIVHLSYHSLPCQLCNYQESLSHKYSFMWNYEINRWYNHWVCQFAYILTMC